ncbi:MAG: response regulator [Kiritimatiellia bacterium]
MSKLVILCVEDEPDVLDAVIRELEPLEDLFPVEAAENTTEARELLQKIRDRGDQTAVIFCDHILSGETGVDFLVDLQRDEEWRKTRKVLLTGQAGLEATVKAVNQAELAHYIAKPWEGNEVLTVARRELALYLRACDLDPLPYLRHLDVDLLQDLIRKHLSSDR